MNEENTLFIRGVKDDEMASAKTSSSEEDIWDDTLLIKAYDKAVEIAKKGFLEKKSLNNDRTTTKSLKKKWKVGDKCKCKYSEDHNYYEAEISNIDKSTGKCTVRYVGYENEEIVFLKNLKPSEGEAARQQQIENAAYEEEETADSILRNDTASENNKNSRKKGSATKTKSHSKQKNGFGENNYLPQFNFPLPQALNSIIPPPPPPHLFRNLREDENETEAMSAMLISWYMNGYHTGYYQGLKMAKNSNALGKDPHF